MADRLARPGYHLEQQSQLGRHFAVFALLFDEILSESDAVHVVSRAA
jgi:hypothetical protein